MSKTDTINIKKINRSRVFQLISSCDKISKQDIANELSMSLPTVTQNLNELLEMGLISNNGSFVSTVGRRARAISLISDARVAVGLDITRNHIALVILDLKGNIIHSVRKRMQTAISTVFYKKLADEIYAFIDEANVNRDKVLGVGITVPGIVYENGTKIGEAASIHMAPDFYDIFHDYLDIPFILLNDAKASGFAEAHFSGYTSNMLYLFLSNTVGGCILIDGKVQTGNTCRSAEFGHMTLFPHGMRCHCGRYGCADPYLCAGFLTQYSNDNLSLFFNELENGNPEYVKIFENYLQNLSIMINNIHVCFDYDIVLGGYIGGYMGKYLDQLKSLVAERLTFVSDNTDFIKSCTLKLESSAVGGALHYTQAFNSSI